MAINELCIKAEVKYVEQLQKQVGSIELKYPHSLGMGKHGANGIQVAKAFARIEAFAKKEIKKLKVLKN